MRWLLACALLSTAPAMAASEVALEEVFPPDASSEQVRFPLVSKALEELLRAEMRASKLDLPAYDEGIARKYPVWREALRQKYKDDPIATTLPEPDWREAFIGPQGVLASYAVKSFQQVEGKPGHWRVEVSGEAVPELLAGHHGLFSAPGTDLAPRLVLSGQVRLVNFSWKDLQLERSQDLVAPIEVEWAKWWAKNLPPGAGAVSLCRTGACRMAFDRWESRGEGKEGFEPHLAGNFVLRVEMSLTRQILDGALGESRVELGGGFFLHEADGKRLLHWDDLASEKRVLRAQGAKEYNSALASWCYGSPLGKFLKIKNQVRRSDSPVQKLALRLENPAHMGQALRLMEWVRQKGSVYKAQPRLESFGSHKASMLVLYQGDAGQFKALVSATKELESEWGRPVTAREQDGELVLSLPPRNEP